jgi:hypothetical protein
MPNRDLDDPPGPTHAGLFRGFILRNSDVGAAALTLALFLFRAVCANHIIWGFHHVASFRRRQVGGGRFTRRGPAHSKRSVSPSTPTPTTTGRDFLRATTRELGPTRDAVLDLVTTRLGLSRTQATDAYALADAHEMNPRSVWGYVQGLTRLSQRRPWQAPRFSLDQAVVCSPWSPDPGSLPCGPSPHGPVARIGPGPLRAPHATCA